jgi:hypothetical protein
MNRPGTDTNWGLGVIDKLGEALFFLRKLESTSDFVESGYYASAFASSCYSVCECLEARCARDLAQRAWWIAIAVATALIPDEVLQAMTMENLFDYRRKTKDAYAAWSTEINRLALRISDMDPAAVSRELPAIIHGEFKPRILDYRNELKAMRDKMFGELVRKVTTWNVPSLSLAYLSGLSVPAAIALFAGTLAPAVPAVVDYYIGRRALERKNSAAYLIGLMPSDGE